MKKVGYYSENGKGYFNIFAPHCSTLEVELDNSHKRYNLTKHDDGYFYAEIPQLQEGELYWLVKDGQQYLPDPYSKRQPFTVHSASMISYPQKADFSNWKGIDIDDAIIYELHLGTFSEEGNLKGAQNHLSYLKSLGINVIELMPIAEFPGDRNWGYDGTYMFALNSGYGTYKDLQNFLNEAHKLGIAVILDIVYNHFGPEGNYSGMLAPFTKDADTPWGAAINFDQQHNSGIRDFYLANTHYWISEVGFDGFRMDAISLVFDNSPKHILKEINNLAKDIARDEGRKIIMIAEHLRNEKHVISEDGFGFDGQWCGDLNYSLVSYLTKETTRHMKDFGNIQDIVKVLKEGFAYDGTKFNSIYQCKFGNNGKDIPPQKIVSYIQNHDEIGNRPHGDRLNATYGIDKSLVAATILFASPYTPLIFMGEEFAELNPFLFFESFTDQWLIDAVSQGRKREFSFTDDDNYKEPHDVQTFIDSKIDWQLNTETPNCDVLEYYKTLIAMKKKQIIGNHDRQHNKISCHEDLEVIVFENDNNIVLCNIGNKDVELSKLNINENSKLIQSSKTTSNKNILEKYSARIYEK